MNRISLMPINLRIQLHGQVIYLMCLYVLFILLYHRSQTLPYPITVSSRGIIKRPRDVKMKGGIAILAASSSEYGPIMRLVICESGGGGGSGGGARGRGDTPNPMTINIPALQLLFSLSG